MSAIIATSRSAPERATASRAIRHSLGGISVFPIWRSLRRWLPSVGMMRSSEEQCRSIAGQYRAAGRIAEARAMDEAALGIGARSRPPFHPPLYSPRAGTDHFAARR